MLAAASIAIAARGGEEETTSKPGANLSALKCPLEQVGSDASGQPKFRAAKDAFDTGSLIGLKLEDARRKAGAKGCEITVSIKDGAGQTVPIELNPKLIYVYTANDVVTQIEGVGGGI